MAASFITIIGLLFWLTIVIFSQNVYDSTTVRDSVGINGNQPNPSALGCALENGENGCTEQENMIRVPKGSETRSRRFGVRGDRFIRLGRNGLDCGTIHKVVDYLSFIDILSHSKPIEGSVKTKKCFYYDGRIGIEKKCG